MFWRLVIALFLLCANGLAGEKAMRSKEHAIEIGLRKVSADEYALSAKYTDSVSGELLGVSFSLKKGRGITSPRVFEGGEWKRRFDVLRPPEGRLLGEHFGFSSALGSIEVMKDGADEKIVKLCGDKICSPAKAGDIRVDVEILLSVKGTVPGVRVEQRFRFDKPLKGHSYIGQPGYYFDPKETLRAWHHRVIQNLKDYTFHTNTLGLAPSTTPDKYVASTFPVYAYQYKDRLIMSQIVDPQHLSRHRKDRIQYSISYMDKRYNWKEGYANGFCSYLVFGDLVSVPVAYRRPGGELSTAVESGRWYSIPVVFTVARAKDSSIPSFLKSLDMAYWGVFPDKPKVHEPHHDFRQIADDLFAYIHPRQPWTWQDDVSAAWSYHLYYERGIAENDEALIQKGEEALTILTDALFDKGTGKLHQNETRRATWFREGILGGIETWRMGETIGALILGYKRTDSHELRSRCKETILRALDYIMSIQHPEGWWACTYDGSGNPMPYGKKEFDAWWPGMPGSLYPPFISDERFSKGMPYPSGSGGQLAFVLLEAYELFGDARRRDAARKALDYYLDDTRYVNPTSVWPQGEGFTFWDVSFYPISYFLKAYSKGYEVFKETRYIQGFNKFLSFLLVMSWHYDVDPFWAGTKQPMPVAGLWSTINNLEVVFCGEAQGMIVTISDLLPFIHRHADDYTFRELLRITHAASKHVMSGFRSDYTDWRVPKANPDWQIPIEGANPNINLIVAPKYGPTDTIQTLRMLQRVNSRFSPANALLIDYGGPSQKLLYNPCDRAVEVSFRIPLDNQKFSYCVLGRDRGAKRRGYVVEQRTTDRAQEVTIEIGPREFCILSRTR